MATNVVEHSCYIGNDAPAFVLYLYAFIFVEIYQQFNRKMAVLESTSICCGSISHIHNNGEA